MNLASQACTYAPMLVMMFLLPGLARRVGKKEVCVNGALLGMDYKYQKGAVQTLENLRTMYDLATSIPAVMFALMALILFARHPLSRKKVEELQEQKERRLRESYASKQIRWSHKDSGGLIRWYMETLRQFPQGEPVHQRFPQFPGSVFCVPYHRRSCHV